METEYEWFNGAVPGDINDDGQLVPLDALMTINYLNGGAGGILPLNRSAGLQAPFWDSNRDNHLSAIDALVVINELNKLQAGEGEAWTQQADRYWHNAGESDDAVDASVDKITVADLESNPITTFPTSRAASASAIRTLQRDDILKITGDFTSTRDDKPDESPAIFDAF